MEGDKSNVGAIFLRVASTVGNAAYFISVPGKELCFLCQPVNLLSLSVFDACVGKRLYPLSKSCKLFRAFELTLRRLKFPDCSCPFGRNHENLKHRYILNDLKD